MIRTFFAAAAIAAAAVSFAPSAGADTPCGSDPVSSIDYALQAVTPDGLELPASYPLSPGRPVQQVVSAAAARTAKAAAAA